MSLISRTGGRDRSTRRHWGGLEAAEPRGVADHSSSAPAGAAQIADAGVAVGLADFLRRRLHHQRVMEEGGGLAPAEEPGQRDLPAGRVEQILSADDERDALQHVVGGGGPLIRPVAEPIANQQIAALPRRRLLLRPEPQVVETLDPFVHPHPPADAVRHGQPAIAAPSGVHRRVDLPARAVAAVDHTGRKQGLQRLPIGRVPLTLPPLAIPPAKGGRRKDVRLNAEPIELVEQRLFELRPAALPVVVLDAQQHVTVERARESPHEHGVHDMADVQVSRRRRSESGQRTARSRPCLDGKRRPVQRHRMLRKICTRHAVNLLVFRRSIPAADHSRRRHRPPAPP